MARIDSDRAEIARALKVLNIESDDLFNESKSIKAANDQDIAVAESLLAEDKALDRMERGMNFPF